MGRRFGFLTSVMLSAVAVSAASTASAQNAPPAPAAPPPAGPPPAAPPTAQTSPPTAQQTAQQGEPSDPILRARLHYERGIQLFNEENYNAALFEFDRAYELAPSYKILYNMGRIQRQQNNYAAALRSYQRYLNEGGAEVPADRRAEIEQELAVLKPRVASINVKVNVDGADVYADDTPVCTATIESSCVGKSPLVAPIIVNGGRHKVTATKVGYAPATSLVSVVGSDVIDLKLDLVSYDRPAAPPTNPWKVPMFIGWGVTGAVLITAGVTGFLTKNAAQDQEAANKKLGATRAELDDAKSKKESLAHVTDGLLIGGLVAAGVSTYLTIRSLSWKGETARANVQVGLHDVRVVGSF